jgi:hypothetical protein
MPKTKKNYDYGDLFSVEFLSKDSDFHVILEKVKDLKN